MESPVALSAYIVTVLQEAATHSATGTQLRAVLELKFPGFVPAKYQCTNLRDFIRRHVPGVGEAGRKGMDYLYTLGTPLAGAISEPPSGPAETQPSPAGHPAPLSEDAAVWRTFASPRTAYTLYGDPETGRLIVVPPAGKPPDAPWRLIPSCSQEKHVEMAREFIKSLSDPSQQELLSQWFGRPQWWISFYRTVQQLRLSLEWNAFRRSRIIDELKTALMRVGVPPVNLPKVEITREPKHTLTAVASSPGKEEETEKLRRVAAAVINNMSAAELRALTVRLGDVLDALGP